MIKLTIDCPTCKKTYEIRLIRRKDGSIEQIYEIDRHIITINFGNIKTVCPEQSFGGQK